MYFITLFHMNQCKILHYAHFFKTLYALFMLIFKNNVLHYHSQKAIFVQLQNWDLVQ